MKGPEGERDQLLHDIIELSNQPWDPLPPVFLKVNRYSYGLSQYYLKFLLFVAESIYNSYTIRTSTSIYYETKTTTFIVYPCGIPLEFWHSVVYIAQPRSLYVPVSLALRALGDFHLRFTRLVS